MSELIAVTGYAQGSADARRVAGLAGERLGADRARGYSYREATPDNEAFMRDARNATIGVGFSSGNVVLSEFDFAQGYLGIAIPRYTKLVDAGFGATRSVLEQALPTRAAFRHPLRALRAATAAAVEVVDAGVIENIRLVHGAIRFNGGDMLAGHVRSGAAFVQAAEFEHERIFDREALIVPTGAFMTLHAGGHPRFVIEPGEVLDEMLSHHELGEAA